MPHRRTSGLAFAIFLVMLFLLISLTPAITGGLWGRFGDRVLNTALTEPIWRMRLGLDIALFGLALILLHLCCAALCWMMAIASQAALPRFNGSRRQWVLLWFIAGVFWLLTANAAWFPNTMLGFPYHRLVATRLMGVTIFQLVTILLAGLALATLAAALSHIARYRRPAMLLASGLAMATTAANLPLPRAQGPIQTAPNVILIGIDSLRMDAVDTERMPHVQRFLAGAMRMPDTITPLARTFPAWASILTGRNPHSTGAFMNLLPRDYIQTGETLPATLRRHGYRTIYAIDETRFSNIDESYGFDVAVTPSIGASDFVIGTFADLPLLNLIVNTRLGAWLFPQLHANRAVYNLYEPDTFIRRVDRALPTDGPLFLALHLTLPHWPYTWASSSLEPVDGPTQRGHYLDTLRRADKQFASLMTVLERQGALRNALVVLLSDHGQAFRGDDVLTQSADGKLQGVGAIENEGHGTSVLSPVQYRVVLGLRSYGSAQSLLKDSGTLDAPVSLVDIAPTLLDLLNLSSTQRFDGISLAPLLQPGTSPGLNLANRIRFTETEYSPFNFSESKLTGSAVVEAARAYQVDPVTDRVSVRLERLDQILRSRQYAAILGNRALAAAMPGVRKDGRRQLVYVSRPFEPDALPGIVSAADRERLKEALRRTFSIELADPEPTGP